MSNDMLGTLVREIVGLPVQMTGTLYDLVKKLGGEDGWVWLSALKRFLRKENPWEKPLFKYDKTKDGWKLLEPGPEFNGKPFTPDIMEFLKSNESYVNGEVMKQRAKELNAHLGQKHAEYLLEHQELISKDWQGKYYLVFPGTVWQYRGGRRNVPCLRWDGGEWYLYFYWLGNDWYGSDRLVRPRE